MSVNSAVSAQPERVGRITLLAHWVASLTGWRRSALACGLGICAAGALPPAHGLPLLVVAFTGLAWLIAGSRSPWRAALAGWWFGFGHFVVGTYWIGAALLTDASRFGWLVVPAIGGLSAGFALFPALAALVVRISGARGAGLVAALAVAWTVVEWLRGHILSGFPMNLIGTAWTVSDGMIQVVSITGAYGLSFVTILAAASPSAVCDPKGPAQISARRWWAPTAALLLLAAIWLGGTIRLSLEPRHDHPDAALRLVQANIAQELKWRPEAREAALTKHMRMTLGAGRNALQYVIWPETAVSYFLSDSPELRAALGALMPRGGLLITGALRRSVNDADQPQLWNSLHALRPDGSIAATYDKHHLVPFGEYVPLRNILSLSKIVYGDTDYSSGPGPSTLRLPGLPPVSVLICYEAIFPGDAVNSDDRPGWLLNVTNDGWFGNTAGPYQHFQAARLRAIEEGLPLVRAANTGISAVIDAHGRIVGRLALGTEGVLDVSLPKALAGPTWYARVGDLTILVVLVVFGLAIALRAYPRRQIHH